MNVFKMMQLVGGGPCSGLYTPGVDQYTKLLLQSDTTDGSTTFVDSAGLQTFNTPGGDVHHETTNAKPNFGATSIQFDGAGDYLTLQSTSDFVFGTGDFTIDFQLRPTNLPSVVVVYDPRSAQGFYPCIYVLDASIRFHVNATDVITGGNLTNNVWHHIALVRYNASTKLYINGTQTGNTYADRS